MKAIITEIKNSIADLTEQQTYQEKLLGNLSVGQKISDQVRKITKRKGPEKHTIKGIRDIWDMVKSSNHL